MKFSLKLDESLFDDDFGSLEFDSTPEVTSEFDDDFSEYESDHDPDNVLPGPAEGSDTGVAGELIALINDEWEAIQGYNNAIATLRSVSKENSFYLDAIKVLEEISAEENVHVGQLQELLAQVSPNAEEIHKGTAEAKSQLGLVNGLLPVESWDNYNSAETNKLTTECAEDTCTLTDIDDDM